MIPIFNATLALSERPRSSRESGCATRSRISAAIAPERQEKSKLSSDLLIRSERLKAADSPLAQANSFKHALTQFAASSSGDCPMNLRKAGVLRDWLQTSRKRCIASSGDPEVYSR